jgi:hypothetical protein
MIRKIHTDIKFPRLPRNLIGEDVYQTSSDWIQHYISKSPEKLEKTLCELLHIKYKPGKLNLNFMKIRHVEGHDDSHLLELCETCYILPYKLPKKATIYDYRSHKDLEVGKPISFNHYEHHSFEATGWCELLVIGIYRGL